MEELLSRSATITREEPMTERDTTGIYNVTTFKDLYFQDYCKVGDWAYHSLDTTKEGKPATILYCSKINPAVCPAIPGYTFERVDWKTDPGNGQKPIETEAAIICSYTRNPSTNWVHIIIWILVALVILFIVFRILGSRRS